MINIGIIGVGGTIRNRHISWIRNTGKFYVKAAADVYEDDRIVKEFGIDEYYTDYRKLLADSQIDAVLVASPHDLHEEHCVAALEAKKHVIVEKPISRNLIEAKNIIAAAERNSVIGMVGFCQRFEEKNQYIKEMLDNNELGTLLSARIDHFQNFNRGHDSWWRDAKRVGGGAVIGSGVHRLDLLRWYFGEAISVYAKAQYMPERLDAEACVHSVIEFDSGVIADFYINWATYKYLYCEGLTISGKKGLIYSNDDTFKAGFADIENGILKDITVKKKYTTMYEHFADCIENGKKPLTSFEEGYKSLQLVRAIYKSIETGKIINPSEIND